MADMLPSRPGQIEATGDDRALFLKVFAGETLAAFARTTVMKGRHVVRNIQFGKTAQFPASGRTTATYHTPGTQILGKSIPHNERTISIDNVLISDVSIATIDEAMSHFDFRGEYSRQCGEALAQTYDRNLLQVGVLAARAAGVAGLPGGSAITNATARTNADSFIASAFEASATMNEKYVPQTGRYCFVDWDLHNLLVQSSSKLIHGDYNRESNGDFSQGRVYRVAGFEIVPTVNLPTTNITTGPAAYQGDYTNTAALFMQRGAIGTVELMGMTVESEYLIEYQTTLMLAKMAVGHGYLRPECAVEVKVA